MGNIQLKGSSIGSNKWRDNTEAESWIVLHTADQRSPIIVYDLKIEVSLVVVQLASYRDIPKAYLGKPQEMLQGRATSWDSLNFYSQPVATTSYC